MNYCQIIGLKKASLVSMHLGLVVVSVVMTAVVMFPTSGMMVELITGSADGDIRETKLPMPIQKAMTSPDASPTRAPWRKKIPSNHIKSLNHPLAASLIRYRKKDKYIYKTHL